MDIIHKKKEDVESPANITPLVDEGDLKPPVTEDAVFGVIEGDGPNYRNLGWVGTSVLMMKTQIGLGVLSIPSAFDTLGLVPGVLCLVAIAIINCWCSYMVGSFKLNHREVYGIDDAAGLMFGTVGREILGAGFILYLTFVAASGILGISIALNAISTHGACTAIFVAVATIGVFCLAIVRTLSRVTVIAWGGLACILIAILIVTIGVGVEDRPYAAPPGPWVSDYQIINNPSFADAISAICTLIFAYGGVPFFFPIIAEMRDPRHYTKSLVACQTVVTVIYVTIGIVVYYYCGSYVASPALGSAGKLIKQIAYGISLPGLLASATICTHLASKHFFVRMLRGSKHLVANTFVHWGTWIGCVLGVAVVAYIIASAIPNFDSLISFIGALLGTLQSFQPSGCMWLYDNWSRGREQRSHRWTLGVCWSVFVVVCGTFLMVAGTYGSVVGIIDSFKTNGGSGVWSCADNSNSV
ncbi:transmembrane amino acid transporter protein-domain-containing protein [Aspergillus sergii]|uniref:Transmembrane amino acid transporter protein-domain-containing protein n=1 Tax=Aspergillus sergii TaxID=1034303 RepID=A0A5N6X8N0_9EURO|nr:transmembrane amino acid transporter protein-domain-containing protein [Aspergillus sergii]